MSLDYPLYEEMVRRKSRGRWFWRIGDYLYYIGLLPLCISPLLFLALNSIKALNPGAVKPFAGFAVFIGAAAFVFFLGVSLKQISYSIAKKEGMDVNKY